MCNLGNGDAGCGLKKRRIDDRTKLHAQLLEIIERGVDTDARTAMAMLGALDVVGGGFDHRGQLRQLR